MRLVSQLAYKDNLTRTEVFRRVVILVETLLYGKWRGKRAEIKAAR